MDKNNNIMKGQGEDGKWITVNGAHVFVQEGQSVEDAMNSKFDKSHPAKKNETNNEVLSVSRALDKTGKATTQSKEVADMYKKNANPHWNFTVKETSKGYEISAERKSNADKELTKRAEALHKTMKEAGLPVKKSIEETKEIIRKLDEMPDY